MKECKYCKSLNKENTHYCNNCGRNLFDMLEKSDFLFGLSYVLKGISIFLMINYILFHLFAHTLLSLSRDKLSIDIYIGYLVIIFIFMIGYVLSRKAKSICENNKIISKQKMKNLKTIKDLDIKNKRVIIRVDFNVPIKNGKITDNNRIVQSLETINYCLKENAKIILMSHLGKVKTEEDIKNNTLLPVKGELEKLLNKSISFSNDLKGKYLEEKINNLKEGEILLLENTRHMDYPNKLESSCDETLSKYWASLGEVFILDAFGSAHRAHASTYGISKYLPHAIGFLIEREIKELNNIKNQNKTIILGGAKVSDKIGVIKNLINSTNKILIGGAMCGTFLKSLGFEVGKTYVEEDKLNEVKNLLNTKKIILPVDVITENGIKKIENINKDESIFDIGPTTISIFNNEIHNDDLILINGTVGMWEEKKYSKGTEEIFNYLKEINAKVIVCGGDTGSASRFYNFTPYYLSTGGGASLEYLEGKTLPAIEIMEE